MDFLKLKSNHPKRDVQNTDQEMNLFVANTQLEETLDNISELSEQISSNLSKSTFVESSKYAFYDDSGKQFIIDNVGFEEEKELADVFNLNSASLSNILTMNNGILQ
ncbi:hypothetical protein TNCV_4949221 [Trichonephila clavipes]|nr:hypothetical protein TNCV_4949221 [Trichonephila clavipes]